MTIGKHDKHEVACKIFSGQKLSFAEYKLALEVGFYKCDPLPNDDADYARLYLYYLGSYYDSPTRTGYICDKHLTKTLKTEPTPGGGISRRMCAWGIHADELERDYLSKDNWRFLRHRFGRKAIKGLFQ